MFLDIQNALTSAANNDDVSFVTFTGVGEYYSSGNDLGNLAERAGSGEDMDTVCRQAEITFRTFVSAFINFPKPIVALVNGPAVGIAVTTLALMDIVVFSDTASIQTPFAALGLLPEGCSSYLFPAIMGPAKANEMLLAGKRLTAAEAVSAGLGSRVIPSFRFRTETAALVSELAAVPAVSLRRCKSIIRSPEMVKRLEMVNAAECRQLRDAWQSPECAEATMRFLQRKAKL